MFRMETVPRMSLEAKVSGSNSVVECQLPKLDVAGSTPVARSIFSISYTGTEKSRVR